MATKLPDRAAFSRKGFVVVRGLFPAGLRHQMLKASCQFFGMQAAKIGLITPKDARQPASLAHLDALGLALDTKDPEAFSWAQDMVSRSLVATRMGSHKPLARIITTLLGCPEEGIVREGGRMVPSLPGNTRRLYTWHAESSWLPLRRNFVNVWAPLFRPKRQGAGTMWLVPGSHKREAWPFAEWRGHSQDTLGRKDHYLQYDVPEEEIHGLPGVAVKAEPGDAVIFHRNILHRSEVNEGSVPTYVWIDRHFDLKGDLTLSSNINLRPYSSESAAAGRPGLRPLTSKP